MNKQPVWQFTTFHNICDDWPWLPYVAPFAVFAAMTYLLAALPISDGGAYLIKTLTTGSTLAVFWSRLRIDIKWAFDGLALISGIGVFGVWIGLEGYYPQIGHSVFDPAMAGRDASSISIGIRLMGASLLVPVIEEFFWRAFVMRFLVASQFNKIPLGQFTWYAFILTAVAFGFEHHRWLPGIVAGTAYGALLCRKRNLCSPIQAHAVTNLLLGLYVIYTKQWAFW